jgi:hypothetical protein
LDVVATGPPTRSSHWAAVVMALVVVIAGCSPSAARSSTPSPASHGIVAEVATYQLVVGQPGRLLVAALTGDNLWLSFGSLGASFRYLSTRAGRGASNVVVATTTAHYLPIPGTPAGDGRPPTLTVAADGRGLYAVAAIAFPAPGYWQVTVSGALSDGSTFSADAAFTVLSAPLVRGVGSLAPRTESPIAGQAGVRPEAIDSRAVGGEPIPDPELHAVSIADAIAAGHPALVVFSSPSYCVSQFCGPVTDLVAELAALYADRADFIHIEIYQDFETGTVNPAALEWLRAADGDVHEPWTFLIDADGRIAASWDTVVTRGEIEPLLEALPVK